jgi:predicted nucleic acid-binding protein
MPVVSNTSPIWNLASIQQLDLLRRQCADVLIPPDVLDELQLESGLPETHRIQQALDAQWIHVEPLKTAHLKQSLMLELDRGEAAAIALALERNIPRVIIDEADGRAAAKVLGLHPMGILGILLRAKHEGVLPSVNEEMQKLRHDAGFFIAESLFQRILVEAGE